MAETYTDQQVKDWARRYLLAAAGDLDYGLVGEMFEEDWEPFGLDFAGYTELMRKVYGLACNAVVTVTFPGEPTEAQRLAERLRALPTVYMDGVEAVPVADLHRVLGELGADAQDGGDRG